MFQKENKATGKGVSRGLSRARDVKNDNLEFSQAGTLRASRVILGMQP